MGLVSNYAMDAVEATLWQSETLTPHQILVRLGWGNIRTVRDALRQLREEGRIVRSGTAQNPLYRQREKAA